MKTDSISPNVLGFLGLMVFILPMSVMLFGCASAMPETIPEGTSPATFFQKAQEASSESRFDDAIQWYSTFIERYPEMEGQIAEAEYEIAFIHYKKGDEESAVKLFEALLQKYRSDRAASWPQWPRVLAVKLLDTINEEGNAPAE